MPKKITSTITRAAFAQKMLDLAASPEGEFVEYKLITDFWTKRFEGIKFPTELVLLVGSSPYRFTAIRVDKVDISYVPTYALVILTELTTEEIKFVYALTCKSVQPDRERKSKQIKLCFEEEK